MPIWVLAMPSFTSLAIPKSPTCSTLTVFLAQHTSRLGLRKPAANSQNLLCFCACLDNVVFAYKDVCRLDVAMDDVILVESLQTFADLNEVLPYHLLHVRELLTVARVELNGELAD